MIWPETHEVVISRQLSPYALRIEVWPQDVEIGMKLDDYLASVVKEIGSPALIMTQAQLLQKLTDAAAQVHEKMKADIVQVMTKSSGSNNGQG